MMMLGPGLVATADEHLPEGSWGQRFMREAAYAAGGQPATSAKVFEEIAADPAIGPASCVLAAQVLQRFGQEQSAVHFLRRAAILTRKEHFRRDWMPLTKGDWFGPELLRSMVAETAALSPNELESLGSLLPDVVSVALKSGVAELKRMKDLPLAERIGPLMDMAWDLGLDDYVLKAARGALPPPDPVVDPAEVAAVVNGVPIARSLVKSLVRIGTVPAQLPVPQRATDGPPLSAAGTVTEMLIHVELAVQYFTNAKGTFDDKGLERHYQQFVEQAGSEKALEAMFGLRTEEIKKLLRDKQITSYVAGELRKKAVAPGDAEVDAAAELWRQGEAREYHVHSIGFPPGAPLPDRVNWAYGLRQLMDKDVRFDVFMQACSGSAANSRIVGGCMGWPSKSGMEEDMRPHILKLKPGEISPPVILPNGHVRLYTLLAVRDGAPAKIKAGRETIRSSLLARMQDSLAVDWFAKAWEQSRIRLIDEPEGLIVNGGSDSPVEDFARQASLTPAAQVALLFSALRDAKTDDAVKAMDEVISLELPAAKDYVELAHALINKGQPALAERAARAGTELDDKHAGSWNELGRALLLLGKPRSAEAAAAMRMAIKAQPDFPGAHRNLGLALEQEGKPGEAIASWRTAVKLKPDFQEAWSDLARGLKEAGKTPEAEEAAAKAATLKENSAEQAPSDTQPAAHELRPPP